MNFNVKNNFLTQVFRRIRLNFLKVYYARGSAKEIALGAAIGAFWGVFPTFGLSTILSLIMYKMIRFNLPVAISAAFISNPITSPFFLVISYQLGAILTNAEVKFKPENWIENFAQIGYILIIGSTIISSITAILVYVLVLYGIKQKRKKEIIQ
jgi:uncharacterized protein (DUF2062 family)